MLTKCVLPETGEPYILNIVGGPNASIEDARKNFNWGFIAEFKNLEELKYYIELDPVHDAVKVALGPLFDDVFVYDIEY